MEKIRCELDPHNRLIVNKAGKKSSLSKFRKVINGRFKVDKNNELFYHVKTPLSKEDTLPHQIRLKGNWSLTDNHDLEFTLNKEGRETFGDKLILRGRILDVKKNSLIFAITSKTKENTQSTYILNLGGSWKADKNNRLTFYVKKETGEHDILVFNNAWEVNKNQRIIYEYEKAELITKKKKIHTLIFMGYWDIKKRFRISYALSTNTDSVFSFKTSAGIFEKNYIKYGLGIELKNKINPVKRTITLFGKWKVSKNIGLVFETEYEDKKIHAMVFAAEVELSNRDTILFKLMDNRNKDMGVDLKLSRKILKRDGEVFLRFFKSKGESSSSAGASLRL